MRTNSKIENKVKTKLRKVNCIDDWKSFRAKPLTESRRNKAMVNYWIFKVKDEVGGLYGRRGFNIFEHRTQECFWGIREFSEKGKREANIDLLKKGDYAVFYLVAKEGSRFLGTCILDSGYTRLDEEQAKKIVHREYIDCDQGVFLRDVDRWAKPLPIENLRGKDSFVAMGGKLGSFFQGSIKKIKHPEDYSTIIKEHKLMA
jgi:predicted RNA-binding protein with PUA-like domain